MPEPRPSVERTRRTVLVIAGVVGAGLAWIALSSAENFGWPIAPVPPFTAVAVAVLAVATWLAAQMWRSVEAPGSGIEQWRELAAWVFANQPQLAHLLPYVPAPTVPGGGLALDSNAAVLIDL